MVANFRSYEGQIRLLTSVIAAHPELKLNYKEIAKHFGSDWTESGIEHFFRPIKKNGKGIQAMVRRGEDAANFNHNTAKGSAGDTTPATPRSSAPKTPRTAGSRKRSAPSAGKSTASKKLKESGSKTVPDFIAGLDDNSDEDFSILTLTPTKKPGSVDKQTKDAREHGTLNIDTNETPSLQSAQTTTPDDEDELRILTPADVGAAFSFSQSAPHASASFDTHTSSWSHGNTRFADPTDEPYLADEYEDEC